MKTIALVILMALTLSGAYSQNMPTQTVRGTIKDADIKIPLIGATIIVEGIEPIMVTTARHGIVKTKKQYNV